MRASLEVTYRPSLRRTSDTSPAAATAAYPSRRSAAGPRSRWTAAWTALARTQKPCAASGANARTARAANRQRSFHHGRVRVSAVAASEAAASTNRPAKRAPPASHHHMYRALPSEMSPTTIRPASQYWGPGAAWLSRNRSPAAWPGDSIAGQSTVAPAVPVRTEPSTAGRPTATASTSAPASGTRSRRSAERSVTHRWTSRATTTSAALSPVAVWVPSSAAVPSAAASTADQDRSRSSHRKTTARAGMRATPVE